MRLNISQLWIFYQITCKIYFYVEYIFVGNRLSIEIIAVEDILTEISLSDTRTYVKSV